MGFWRRLFGGSSQDDLKPQRLDYLNEALALERQGDYDAALTSYRLALRDHPTDARILQNMAIAFTKTRRYDEAIRHYRRALELDNDLAGAHYGLAFLLLNHGDPDGAAQHLRAFLTNPPRGPDAQKWIEHATQALGDLGTPAPQVGRLQEGGGALRGVRRGAGAVAVLCAALGCSQLAPDLDSVVAIEIVLPDSGFLEVGDTLYPVARPLNGRGDSVPAPVTWGALDPAVVEVVDDSGVRGKEVGTGRIQARVGNLRSNPVTLVVQPPLDSIRGTVILSSVPSDTLSDSLQVRVFADTPATLTGAQTLLRRRVTFEPLAVFPPTGSTVTLVPNDTVFTNASGIAAVQVRLDAGTPPDSVLVTARAFRGDGSEVPGSPITFVVEFRP